MDSTKLYLMRSQSDLGLRVTKPADENLAIETVSLGFNGANYVIDLSLPSAAMLVKRIAEFIKAENLTPTSSRTPVARDGEAEFVDATTVEVRRLLTSAAASYPDLLESEPSVMAEKMVASIPTRHEYGQLVGPFYDTTGLRKWLSLSRQALAARVEAGSLLACTTQDGSLVYPAWQFRPDGKTVPHLPALIKILRKSAATPWTVAAWLRAPGGEAVDGMDAVSWLADGGDPEPLLAEARDDAARWAS